MLRSLALRTFFLFGFLVSSSWLCPPVSAVQCDAPATGGRAGLPNPVLFVAQFPIAGDFATIGSTFANHFPNQHKTGRGGDLYILYPDGQLCNVTREAGFGEGNTFQGEDSIAVRDPHVHWEGDRALFSMVIGSPEQQFQVIETYWQFYEVTGLAQGEPVSITRVTGQPGDFNNITPIYSPDGRIVFTSDRPRDGRRHLYPQHDEYESTPTNTGLWGLDPQTGEVDLLNHTPSGAFTPIVDSFGRILFTRWDHLQRDQQADVPQNEPFNWASEEEDAATLPPVEVFPEPRLAEPGSTVNGLRFNHFFPWQIHPDGTEEETLNHIGRHELHEFFTRSFVDDDDLEDFIAQNSGRFNPNGILNFFHIQEDPQTAGTYFGVDAPEFQTHSGGMILKLTAPPTQSPDLIAVSYVTDPATRTVVGDDEPVPPEHSGHYRDPLPLSDGTLLSAHTFETRAAFNEGTRANPDPRYEFRLRELQAGGGFQTAGVALTQGLQRTLQYWDPDVMVSYSGELWELQPVEVRTRPVPPVPSTPLPSPEAQIFAEEGVDPEALRSYLEERELALVISRDVTTRDEPDRQQPFNLAVPGGTQTTGTNGQIYDVRYLQFFQGDQIRGLGGPENPIRGRRVLARPMHEAAVDNPPSTGPEGSVTLAADGSMAAMVPAHRAMTWQLADPDGEPVVRERYWLTFQPGEMRVCASCHGLNSNDQAGGLEPSQPPEALRQLLQHWKARNSIFADGFEGGDTTAWTVSSGLP